MKFIFIGDGSLRKYLEDEVRIYRKNIIFSGALPLSSVKLFLDQATVVWIPMSGYVMLEAAALGKPIVAFDVEWHNEFIKSGVNGFLVPNRSIDFLSDAVIKLLKNPSLANKYGNNARRTLLHKFNPKSILKNEAKLYTDLLSRKK
jgi:glycosyltransferase involved in cell wall biosynthesis